MAIGNMQVTGVCHAITRLKKENLLTQKNFNALLTCGGVRASRILDQLNEKFPVSRNHIREKVQEFLDRIIREIEEEECDTVAKVLGQRNGRLSESELELRLPPEVIGNIAELGTSHGKPDEYYERARILAAEEEQRLLPKDSEEIAALGSSHD
jgi:hypothetical protein